MLDKKHYSGAGELFKYTSPAPEKPLKYLQTPFRRQISIYTHFSGAGEVLIHTDPGHTAVLHLMAYIWVLCLQNLFASIPNWMQHPIRVTRNKIRYFIMGKIQIVEDPI